MPELILTDHDIFDPRHQWVGHGVNTVGVMGSGIAPQFARRYPGLLEHYQRWIQKQQAINEPLVGTTFTYIAPSGVRVANIFSQDFPGPHARIDWIHRGVWNALESAPQLETDTPLHLPWIGAGIGGLTRWEVAQLLRSIVNRAQMSSIVVHELPREATIDTAILDLFDRDERQGKA